MKRKLLYGIEKQKDGHQRYEQLSVIKLVSCGKVATAVLYSHQPSIGKQISASLLMMIAAILPGCLHMFTITPQRQNYIS